MIFDIMGLCRICNKSHKLPIYGAVLEGQNSNITVYNTLCNLCIEKVDYILKNKLISREDNLPVYITRKIVTDVATNTDNIHNYKYQMLSENRFSNQQDIETESYVRRKSQRCLFCEFCKKKFTHAGDLNKHRRKHTGEQPYDCSLCNRKFSHTSNLIRHQRLHSGEKPFICPLKCGRNFSRKDKLSNHVIKYHPST